MVVSKHLLDFLVCPEDHTPLSLAEPALLDRLNALVVEGKLTNRGGEKVRTRIDSGLLRHDGKYLYPVVEDIPILLIDEAIPLEHVPAD